MPRTATKYYKTVKRTLADGTVKTYTYVAGRYKKRGGIITGKSLLVGKGGKVYQDRLVEYFKKLKAEGATPTQLARAKQELNLFIKQKQEGKLRDEGARLTVRSLGARLVKNKYASMFLNAGYDLDNAAQLVGATAADIINEDNWTSFEDKYTGQHRTVFTFNGHQFEFVFSYYGSVWKQIA